jgi:hypothetical protein
MDTRQKIILTVFAIVGLPGLPLACLYWLLNRYIFGNRNQTWVEFITFMAAITFTTALFGGLYLLLTKLGC